MSWYDDPYASAQRWRDRYGLFDYFSAEKDHVQDQDEILSAVRRSANLIVNGELDASIEVDWNPESFGMNGEARRPNTIYLSPEILRDRKLSRQQVIDILIGTTIIYGYLHRLPPQVNVEFSRAWKAGEIAKDLMQSFQNYIARQLIGNEYGGYRPFLESYKKYYTGSKLAETIWGKLEQELTSSAITEVTAEQRAIFDECKRAVFGTTDELVRAKAIIKAVRDLRQISLEDETNIKERGKDGEPCDSYGTCYEPILGDAPREYSEDKEIFNVKHVIPARAPAKYKQEVVKLASRIRALRSRLKFRADKRSVIEHALRSGDVDEGSVYKLGFHKCGVSEERIFEMPMILSSPDVHVHLLIDESGSMGGGKIVAAREMTITIAEALTGLPGVRLSIWGHSGQGGYHGDHVKTAAVARYVDVGDKDYSRLSSIHASSQNIDGAAIRECQKYMVQRSPDASKLLIVLSDGCPAGNGYGGKAAMKHTKDAVDEARQKQIQVVSIGVGGHDGSELYGTQHSVALRGPDSLVPVSNIIVAAINRASMLKEV